MKKKQKPRNYVHKYMEQFHKPKTHNSKKDYKRKPKYKPNYEEE